MTTVVTVATECMTLCHIPIGYRGGRRDSGLTLVGVGGCPLLADRLVALTVYDETVLDTLYRDTLFPHPKSNLTLREMATRIDPLENAVHRVSHMLLLALWGFEGFGIGR